MQEIMSSKPAYDQCLNKFPKDVLMAQATRTAALQTELLPS